MLGKLLQGRYQVVQVLSVGGFGETYIAQDIHRPGHPTCVVKHLKAASNDPSSVETLRRLFTREAHALKQLGNYDQVPELLAHFEENQEFYLVQEFIEGHPLSQELLPGDRWTERQVVQLLLEVLGILHFVHSHGLIHRDLKPSNIIRRQHDRRLVLIDFGSAKQAWTLVVTAQGQTSTTFAVGIPATIAIGTPGYMSTEQGRGRPRPNSDIYALGMIGIQALTGLNPTQLLEDSDTGEIIWQHHTQVSPELASVLNKMVRYHFKDRYQSATEALQALQPLANLYLPTVTATSVPQAPLSEQSHIQCPTGKQSPTAQPVPTGSQRQSPPAGNLPAVLAPPQATSVGNPPSGLSHRLPTRLLLPLRIGIAMGFAAVMGVLYAYIQLNEIKTLKKEAKYEECITKAQLASNTAKTFLYKDAQGLLNECQLEHAKTLAAGKNLAAAIKAAKKIPKDTTLYPEAQKLIKQWSEI